VETTHVRCYVEPANCLSVVVSLGGFLDPASVTNFCSDNYLSDEEAVNWKWTARNRERWTMNRLIDVGVERSGQKFRRGNFCVHMKLEVPFLNTVFYFLIWNKPLNMCLKCACMQGRFIWHSLCRFLLPLMMTACWMFKDHWIRILPNKYSLPSPAPLLLVKCVCQGINILRSWHFMVPLPVAVKTAVFWDVTPCSLVAYPCRTRT
jgi:hypothetical protein